MSERWGTRRHGVQSCSLLSTLELPNTHSSPLTPPPPQLFGGARMEMVKGLGVSFDDVAGIDEVKAEVRKGFDRSYDILS